MNRLEAQLRKPGLSTFLFWFLVWLALMLSWPAAYGQTARHKALSDATDCTSLSGDFQANQFCFEVDDETWFVCKPTAGGCDTPGEWVEIGASGVGQWTRLAAALHPNTITDDVVIGATTPLSGAKLSVNGDADQIQSLIQGNGTQTASLFRVESSTAEGFFEVDGDGGVVISGVTPTLTIRDTDEAADWFFETDTGNGIRLVQGTEIRMYLSNTGNAAFGKDVPSSPTTDFIIHGDNLPILRFAPASGSGENRSRITWLDNLGNGAFRLEVSDTIWELSETLAADTIFAIDDGALTNTIRIAAASGGEARVGIGVVAPTTALDVLGTVTAPIVLLTPATPPSHTEGQIFYTSDDKALAYHNEESEVAVTVGREVLLRARNASGSTILKSKVVRLDGAQGDKPRIVLAQADTEANAQAVGLALHDIETGTDGYVTLIGGIGGLDTSSLTEGDILYLSAATAGDLVSTAPALPVPIAQAVRINPSNGVIAVGIRTHLPESTADDAISRLAQFDSGLCGTNEILEDQGGSWACIATPGINTVSLTVDADPGDITLPAHTLPSHWSVLVDTFAAGATTTLEHILGIVDGDMVHLSSVDAARDTTFDDSVAGTGTMNLAGSANFTLTNPDDVIHLRARTGTIWSEVSRSTN